MKTKYFSFFIFALITLFGLSFCKRDETKPIINKEKLTGWVQKGPFVNGTSVSLSELSSSLDQTGKVFTTQISNNSGSFEINNISLTSSYVQLAANGFYFDEVKGSLSAAPLNLYALSDITDISTININLITHLEKLRVEYLVNHNLTFLEAKKTAQSEILAIFGFSLIEMENSELLDISVNSEGNAILLAISIILQGNRSVAELSELLANFSNDIREDGIMDNQNLINELRTSTKSLDLSSIRTNLENRYNQLGIDASIPDFEKYIQDFLLFTAQKPTIDTDLLINKITTSSALVVCSVNPNSLSTQISIEYGLTTDYGSIGTGIINNIVGVNSVIDSLFIYNLLPGATYHFRIKAENDQGISYSNDQTFTTLGKVTITVKSPNIQTHSAQLNGNINSVYFSTRVTFEYGISENYGYQTDTILSQIKENSFVSTKINGLMPATIYHYRLKAENTAGIFYSNDMVFTTLGQVPIINTIVVNEGSDMGTIKASVNPGYLSTEVVAEYGPTTNYGYTITFSGSPIISGAFVNIGGIISGLSSETIYHVRIKATNELGTTTGDDMTFKTIAQITDVEGNIYRIFKIGSQVWMGENLKTTKFSNGDLISGPSYQCGYNQEEKYVPVYGRLYNWTAVTDNRNLCPTNWHMPTYSEWSTLISYLGGFTIAGGKLKETGTVHWLSPNQGATNEYGFTGLPGGAYIYNSFQRIGKYGHWWSSSTYPDGNPKMILMYYNYTSIGGEAFAKDCFYSVRCIKD